MLHTTARLSALAVLSIAALTACSAADSSGDIEVVDPWVKAVDEGMTATFGDVVNGTSDEVALVSASSPAASVVELHETVTGDDGVAMMQAKDEGFLIAAGETLTLEPGGNHLMFLGVTAPIEPGDEVPVTLAFDDGSTLEITAVAKEFAGANEEYDDGMDMEHDG